MFHYRLTRVLGKGTYGTVYAAQHKVSGKEFAIKIIPKEWHRQIDQELGVWQKVLDLKSTVHVDEVVENKDCVMLVMEKLHETLQDRVHNTKGLNEIETAVVTYDLLHWLRDVHNRNVCYADIKPANIMFRNDASDEPVVIDFGCSKMVPTEHPYRIRHRAGTAMFMAPEVLLRAYDQRADIWSLGILVFYMMHGTTPFLRSKDMTQEEYEKLVLTFESEDIHQFSHRMSPLAADFVKKLLVYEPDRRMGVNEALHHPFIQENISIALSK